jgi:hypothetical protein
LGGKVSAISQAIEVVDMLPGTQSFLCQQPAGYYSSQALLLPFNPRGSMLFRRKTCFIDNAFVLEPLFIRFVRAALKNGVQNMKKYAKYPAGGPVSPKVLLMQEIRTWVDIPGCGDVSYKVVCHQIDSITKALESRTVEEMKLTGEGSFRFKQCNLKEYEVNTLKELVTFSVFCLVN